MELLKQENYNCRYGERKLNIADVDDLLVCAILAGIYVIISFVFNSFQLGQEATLWGIPGCMQWSSVSLLQNYKSKLDEDDTSGMYIKRYLSSRPNLSIIIHTFTVDLISISLETYLYLEHLSIYTLLFSLLIHAE